MFRQRNIFQPRKANKQHLVENYFLGAVVILWLESHGVAVLHASTVVLGDRSVGFLSGSGGGKSSLGASFLGMGRPLLSDGILPLERRGKEIIGRSGYPYMRLWPSAAECFLGGDHDLDSVIPDHPKRRILVGTGKFVSFCPEAPLTGLFLLDCREGGTERLSSRPSRRVHLETP